MKGGKTIGVYDKRTKKLCCSELVRSDKDITEFYKKYGIERNER